MADPFGQLSENDEEDPFGKFETVSPDSSVLLPPSEEDPFGKPEIVSPVEEDPFGKTETVSPDSLVLSPPSEEDPFGKPEVKTKVAPEVKSLITQFTDLFTKTSDEKKSLYRLPYEEHMARALGVYEDPNISTAEPELVGFDPSGIDIYEKRTGKPRWQIEKRTKPSPYERTMAELADDPEWNRVGKLIYDYEQKNKGVSSVLELPADSGETALVGSPHDLKMGKGMSHGEWLQERFSKGFFDLTSLG